MKKAALIAISSVFALASAGSFAQAPAAAPAAPVKHEQSAKPAVHKTNAKHVKQADKTASHKTAQKTLPTQDAK